MAPTNSTADDNVVDNNDDSDYNSDVDIVRHDDPYFLGANTGLHMISKMQANAKDLRCQTKQNVNDVDCLGITPGSREVRKRTITRFNHFRQTVLKKPDLSQPFTGEDMTRFIDVLRTQMVLPVRKTVPNGLTLVRAFVNIKVYGEYQYADFRLSVQELSRFKAFYQGLVRNQQVVIGHWYERQWLGFMTMSRMVRSWFNHHLQKGTASWDVVIAKALSITLMSALGCRSGDVAKSRLYTTEVLRYRDIEITIDTADESKEPSLSDLRVMIKLEHCKGSKFEKNTP